ncbi:MAG: hypothetical protein IPK20_25765 [Betaproteobacteria bacterium]|nr:hypothetical protein [Betaproteobacteria bacterium]
MYAISTADRKWAPESRQAWNARSSGKRKAGPHPARAHDQGRVIKMHGHLGREELYMVSGRMRLGEFVLSAGDYHHTALGERHDVEALEDCMFYAMTEKVIPGR